MGRRSVRQSAPRKQTDLSFDRLFDLSLVPRHGARVVRERCDCRDHESRIREHQSRSRRTARCRSGLHDVCASNDRRRRLADECLAHAGSETVCRRDLFSAGRSLRSACFSKSSRADCSRLETGPRKNCRAGIEDCGGASRIAERAAGSACQNRHSSFSNRLRTAFSLVRRQRRRFRHGAEISAPGRTEFSDAILRPRSEERIRETRTRDGFGHPS